MGIVKVSNEIHEELRKASKSFDRSLNGQAEHWLKVGLIAEINPKLCYQEILELLLTNDDLRIEDFLKKKKRK